MEKMQSLFTTASQIIDDVATCLRNPAIADKINEIADNYVKSVDSLDEIQKSADACVVGVNSALRVPKALFCIKNVSSKNKIFSIL